MAAGFLIEKGVLTKYTGKKKDVRVPAGVREIGPGAFAGRRDIQSVELPEGACEIAWRAFKDCCALVKIRIPSTVTEIARGAFEGCERLSKIDYPLYASAADGFSGTPHGMVARKWLRDCPGKQVPAVFTKEFIGTLSGNWSGAFLNTCGWRFFDANRKYHIDPPDANGVVEVSSLSGYEDADKDGFGGELCYDWWLLDKNLEPIPGVKGLRGYSNLDKQNAAESWSRQREEAGKLLRGRK